MHPQPVPSKAALRVLRQLAFAGSAAAAVGIGTFNYHVYRRIRVLQKIRDTSRQIRAVSNHDGRADVARRIEAAEMGEDFSLEAMRAYRSRKRRSLKYESGMPGSLLVGEGVWVHPPPPVPSIATDGAPEITPYESPVVPHLPPAPDLADQTSDGLESGPSKESTRRIFSHRTDSSSLTKTRRITSLKMMQSLPVRRIDPVPQPSDETYLRFSRTLGSVDDPRLFLADSFGRFGPTKSEADQLLTASRPKPAISTIRRSNAFRRIVLDHAVGQRFLPYPADPDTLAVPRDQPTTVSDGDPYVHSTSTGLLAAEKMLRDQDVSRWSPIDSSLQEDQQDDLAKTGLEQDKTAVNTRPEQPAMMDTQEAQQMDILEVGLDQERPAMVAIQQEDPAMVDMQPDISATVDTEQEDTFWSPLEAIELGSPTQEERSGMEPAIKGWYREPDSVPDMGILAEPTAEPTAEPMAELDDLALSSDITEPEAVVAPASAKEMAEFWFDSQIAPPELPSRQRRIWMKLRRAHADLSTPFGGVWSKPVLAPEDRAQIARHLRVIFKSSGRALVQRAWDMVTAQRLYYRDFGSLTFFYQEFSCDGSIRMRPKDLLFRELMQYHRESGKHSYEAAEMLFPDYILPRSPTGPSYGDNGHLVHRIAAQHLDCRWAAEANPLRLILDLRRVIHAARLREVLPTEGLFHPVIRALSWVGEMDLAQTIFDEMVFYHGIRPSLSIQALIITGYARRANWDRVEREIELIHAAGLSRTAPHDYATMLSTVLRVYGRKASIDQTHTFLVKAVSQWGLIPNSFVHSTVIGIFLERQRFDLVREWVEIYQGMFSQIPMQTVGFCISITEMWARLGSSCEEIEQGIRAMAYRNPKSNLRWQGRHLFYEALSRDLSPRITSMRQTCSTHEVGPETLPDQRGSMPKTLDRILSEASYLTMSARPADEAVAVQMAELRQQALAAARLRIFLSDQADYEFLDVFCYTIPATSSTSLVQARTDTTMQTECFAERMPAISDIPTQMTQQIIPERWRVTLATKAFYRHGFQLGMPTNFGLLPWISDQLRNGGRTAEGLMVLINVYFYPPLYHRFAGLEPPATSPMTRYAGRTGAPSLVRAAEGGFKIDFYQHWLQLGFLAANLGEIVRVLREVVLLSEMPPSFHTKTSLFPGADLAHSNPLQVSLSFACLARHVINRVLKKSWKPLRTDPNVYGMGSSPQELDNMSEMVWLGAMVENRRKDQIGRRELPLQDGTWWASPDRVLAEREKHGWD